MLRLVVDEALCVGCGNCEAWLPKLLKTIRRGSLLISELNPDVDHGAIQRAVDGCFLEALSLETINDERGEERWQKT